MSPRDVPTSQPSAFGAHRKGEPDAPEEQNPLGHDSQPHDADIAGEPATVSARPTPGAPFVSSATSTPLADAKFLKDEFGIRESAAARLVADGRDQPDTSGRLMRDLHGVEKSGSSLEGVPTPEAPASDLTSDTDEERLTPVVGSPNRRTGGG